MSQKQLSLYIHSPFCSHKCGYCDFNSWAEKDALLHRSWLNRVVSDIRLWKERFSEGSINWKTVFFGGGTPSLLSDELLLEIGDALKAHGIIGPHIQEFSVELNPEDISKQKLDVLSEMGVTRLSVGIQSFDPKNLLRLERQASAAGNRAALELLSAYWGKEWSMDLMYALPGQKLCDFEKDLDEALSYSPKHLSLYQLTLSTARSKNWEQAEESELAEFFALKRSKLLPLGFEHYEVSNFAKEKKFSLHNKVYWELGEYLGVGPGAYGLLSPLGMSEELKQGFDRFGFHQKAPSSFQNWVSSERTVPQEVVEKRGVKSHLMELLMMGLRLSGGVQKTRLGGQICELLMTSNNLLELLEEKNGFIRPTQKGLYLLDTTVKNCFSVISKAEATLDSKRVDPIFGQ